MGKTRFGAHLVTPILAVLLLLAPGRAALGQTPGGTGEDEFRRRFDEGQRLYLARQVQDALREFDAAYAIRAEPRVQCARGNALYYLKRSGEALSAYERCQKEAQDLSPEEQEQVRAAMQKVRDAGQPPKQEQVQVVVQKATMTTTPPVRQARQPIYRKWWFWTAVGVVSAGAVTGVVLGTQLRPAPLCMGGPGLTCVPTKN